MIVAIAALAFALPQCLVLQVKGKVARLLAVPFDQLCPLDVIRLMCDAGDEGRGIKAVRAKCISCDRPLNIVRSTLLGKLADGAWAVGAASVTGGHGGALFSCKRLS